MSLQSLSTNCHNCGCTVNDDFFDIDGRALCVHCAVSCGFNETSLVFLLIQKNQILDVKPSPVTLSYFRANKQANIIVAAGVIDPTTGEKEICSIVGRYRYLPFATRWGLYSPIHNEEIEITDPGTALRDALYALKRKGLLSDPVNLSQVTLTAY